MPDGPDAAQQVLDEATRRAPALHGRARVIGVDGPAGSGKTTLAGRVADAARVTGADVCVVHLDDLYSGWRGVLGIGPQVHALLQSLHRSGTATYRRYDWHQRAYAEEHRVALPDLLVLEGVGSCPPAVDDLLTLRVWVDAPPDVRLQRGLERDGDHLRQQWLQFLADEEQVHRRDGTRERADLVVDGTTGAVRDGARDPREPR